MLTTCMIVQMLEDIPVGMVRNNTGNLIGTGTLLRNIMHDALHEVRGYANPTVPFHEFIAQQMQLHGVTWRPPRDSLLLQLRPRHSAPVRQP